jgi:hypothetical protein
MDQAKDNRECPGIDVMPPILPPTQTRSDLCPSREILEVLSRSLGAGGVRARTDPSAPSRPDPRHLGSGTKTPDAHQGPGRHGLCMRLTVARVRVVRPSGLHQVPADLDGELVGEAQEPFQDYWEYWGTTNAHRHEMRGRGRCPWLRPQVRTRRSNEPD